MTGVGGMALLPYSNVGPVDPELESAVDTTMREADLSSTEGMRGLAMSNPDPRLADAFVDVDRWVDKATMSGMDEMEMGPSVQPILQQALGPIVQQFQAGLGQITQVQSQLLEMQGQLTQMMRTHMAEMRAPRSVIRDPQTGEVVGVKVGAETRMVQRGPDGSISGLSPAQPPMRRPMGM